MNAPREAFGLTALASAPASSPFASMDACNVHRGRYAAAQLDKLTTVNGHFLPLGAMVAPYLGNVEDLVPKSWVQVFRRLGAFRVPYHTGRRTRFPVYAEEVRGATAVYKTAATMRWWTRRRMPHDAVRRDYWCVAVDIPREVLFLYGWERRFGAPWPMTRRGVHPGLARLVQNSELIMHQLKMRSMFRHMEVEDNRRRLAAGLPPADSDDDL